MKFVDNKKNFSKKILKFLGILLAITVVFLWFLHPIVIEGDIFHHLYSGRWIIENHQISSIDEWTFTSKGELWVANAWGSDIVFYLIFSSFGYIGLSILFSLIGVTTIFLLFIWLRLNEIKYSNALFASGIVMAIISARWPNKPEIIVYPLVLGILIINKLHQKKPNVIYFLPLLMFLWSILYGSSAFVGASILILLILKKFYIEKFKFKSIKFYIIYLMSLLVIFFNGLGLKNVFYFLFVPNIKSYLPEWKSLFFNMFVSPFDLRLRIQYQILMFLIYLIIFILMFIFKFKDVKKEKLLLILSLAIVLPFTAIRNIPLSVILSIVLWVKLLPNKKNIIYFILPLFLVISFLTNQHGIGFTNQDSSKKMISFFKENNLEGNVLVNQNMAPFLSFELYPKILVFFDTRDELFVKNKVANEYIDSLTSYEKTQKLIDKYNISILLVDSSLSVYEPLLSSPDWKLVGLFNQNVLFVKKDITDSKNLKTYVTINPFTKSFNKNSTPQKAVEEYKELLNSQKDSPFLNFALANSLLYSKNFKESIKILKNMEISYNYPLSIILNHEKYDLLILNYLNSKNCSEIKIYIDKYSQNTNHKLIFDPFYKIPGSSDDYYYFIYYSLCSKNYSKAQSYFNNFINDKNVKSDTKDQAIKIMESSFGKSKLLLQ